MREMIKKSILFTMLRGVRPRAPRDTVKAGADEVVCRPQKYDFNLTDEV